MLLMEEKVPVATGRKRTIAVIVVLLAAAMDLLDTSVVNVAIPSIHRHLGSTDAQIQWTVAGYTLAFAAMLMSAGRAGDVFGYRRVFMIGIGAFTACSVLCGLAPNATALAVARIAQGASAALMVPQATSMIQLMYKPGERGKVLGLMGAIGGGAAALGPLVGGAIVNANIAGAQWRPVFLLNVPLGLLALLVAPRFLPPGRSQLRPRWDLPGAMLAAATLSLTTGGLIEGSDHHWAGWTIGLLVAGALCGAALYVQQRRAAAADRPVLVEPVVATLRTFRTGLGMSLMLRIVLGGMLITLTLVLQTGLGYSPLKAGLTTVPMTFGMIVGVALLAETLVPRLGRTIFLLGSVVLLVGLAGVAAVLHHRQYTASPWILIVPLIVFGIGLGAIIGPLFAITLQDVPTGHAGSASGTLEAIEQLGGSLGVVIMSSIFFNQVPHSSPASAFAWVAAACAIPVVLTMMLTPLLPRRFKSEEELGLDELD